MTVITVSAPAKINLHLEVLRKRDDGFHELATLFASIDLADRLHFESSSPTTLELGVHPVGSVPAVDNLVLKAARALWREIGRCPGARITLDKRIPVGGGLGGGSADAAAALVGLNALWNLDLETSTLNRLAAELGSDVPFFLVGGLAAGWGRGEELIALDDPGPIWLVVAWPGVGVSTAQAFGACQPRLRDGAPRARLTALAKSLGDGREAELVNDLEPTVFKAVPEVGELLERLQGFAPVAARMSGSGSSCWARFDSEAEAWRVADQLGSIGHRVVRVLSREEARLQPIEEDRR